MIDIFDKLNAAYGDQTLADSDQIKDKKFGKKQDVLNKEILDPDDPNSLKSKVDSFNGIVIDPDNVVSTDKSDIEVGSSKIPTGNAVAGAISDAALKAGVFDISAYNLTNDQPTPYADLEAALGNNGENVPEAVRKGGMQVKFIQGSVGSSDNKYVQYRCIADEFTTDTTQWAFSDEGVYVENPEFIYVKTDREGKILWAIKIDGGIYYGAGCPQQVKDYIEEKISSLSLDEYEDIVAFLSDYLGSDTTLKTMIDSINERIPEIIGSPEFLEVTTDSEDKVLEGIQHDGTKVIGGDLNVEGSTSINGDIKILGNMEVSGVSYKVIENPEYLAAWLDAENKVIFGLKADGKTYVGDADFLNEIKNNQEAISEINATIASINTTIESLDIDALSYITAVENPEYLKVELDDENKILSGTKADGSHYAYNMQSETIDAKVDKENGKSLIDKEVSESLSAIEDLEGRSEITTDAEGKVISWRKPDGTKVENKGIETNSLVILEEGMTDFIKAIKNSSTIGINDVSDKNAIELPEPKNYGLLNLIISNLPTSSSIKGKAQYYDFTGNTFELECEVSPQGQSSRFFAETGGKGNYTLDLSKDVKFGSWVPQDSFHLKGCAKDVTRSYLPTSYKLAYKMLEYLDANPSRVLVNESNITVNSATGNRTNDWPNEARCLPDGFPCELYINGEYWGLYSLQLKKHRKNYLMDKKDYTSFFLDADDFGTDFWNGTINWEGFDIKGPKDLYTNIVDTEHHYFKVPKHSPSTDYSGDKAPSKLKTADIISMYGSVEEAPAYFKYTYDDDGKEAIEYYKKGTVFKAFDGDAPKELLGTDTTGYDAESKEYKGSAQTKDIIRSFSTKYLEVKGYIDNEDIDGAKAKFNEYFDYNACMLVYIFNCLMANQDSLRKNTLWAIYKGGKIAPMLWDLDSIYGEEWVGIKAYSPSAYMWEDTYATFKWPLSLFWNLYEDEIKTAYARLRTDKVISMESWRDVVYTKWVNRIGKEAYERDLARWPETPSYRKNYTNTEYWYENAFLMGSHGYPIWNELNSYNAGDIVILKMSGDSNYVSYQCKVANTGVCPVTKFYDSFPELGGFYDSPKRMEKWMIEQIRLCDAVLGYTENI